MKAYLEPTEIKIMERVASCLRDRLLIRILFRLGCRVSEVLHLKVSDIDFEQGTVTILHLKTRVRLSCSKCKANLGRRHQFCPECGMEVNKTRKRHQEHRRIRTLPVDRNTLEMLRDYVDSKQATSRDDSMPLFGLNRHRAWQIIRDCARRADLPDLVNPETGRVRGVSEYLLLRFSYYRKSTRYR